MDWKYVSKPKKASNSKSLVLYSSQLLIISKVQWLLTRLSLQLNPSIQTLRKNKQPKNPNNFLLAEALQTWHEQGVSWIPESQLACLHGDFHGVQFPSRLPGRLQIFQREENGCTGTALEPLIPETQILQQQQEATKKLVFSGNEMEEK